MTDGLCGCGSPATWQCPSCGLAYCSWGPHACCPYYFRIHLRKRPASVTGHTPPATMGQQKDFEMTTALLNALNEARKEVIVAQNKLAGELAKIDAAIAAFGGGVASRPAAKVPGKKRGPKPKARAAAKTNGAPTMDGVPVKPVGHKKPGRVAKNPEVGAQIQRYVSSHPKTNQKAIAEALSLDGKVVTQALAKLSKQGAITGEGATRGRTYSAATNGASATA
jgi:hypothetical protein